MRTRLVVAVTTILLFLTATPAAATAPGLPWRDCLNPPMPTSPMSGVAYGIDNGPKAPVAGDPFNSDTATMYDAYGYSGFGYGMFDQPTIGPDTLTVCQPISFDMDLRAANLLTDIATVATAVTARLTRLVTDGTFGSVWDPVQASLTQSVGGKLFLTMIGFSFAGASILALWLYARRGDMSKTAGWTAKASLIVVAATLCMGYMVGVGATVDKGIALAFSSAGEMVTEKAGREPADMIGITMVDNVLYPTWVRATFGDDKKAADEFAAPLWRAGTFTRGEQVELNQAPGAGQAKIDAKREQYKTVMEQIKTKYPQTYPLAAGQDTRRQMFETLIGAVGVLSGAWFALMCLVLVLWGAAVARICIGLFPAVAVPAVFPRLHGMAADVGGIVVKAVYRAAVATFAFFAYMVSVIGTVMRADMHPIVRALTVLVASVAMFVLLRRFNVTPNPRELYGRVRGVAGSARPRWAHGRAEEAARYGQGTPYTSPDPTTMTPGAPGGPGGRGGPGGVTREPAEAKFNATRRGLGDTVNFGRLRSTTGPRSSRVMHAGAAVAGRSHPVAAAALTTGAVYTQLRHHQTQRKALPTVGSSTHQEQSPTRRALPPAPRNTVTRAGVGGGATVQPRTYQDTMLIGSSLKPRPAHQPASTAVVKGVVVAGARGYHTHSQKAKK